MNQKLDINMLLIVLDQNNFYQSNPKYIACTFGKALWKLGQLEEKNVLALFKELT